MQDTWYGDHRDLVKWGAVVHIARRDRISNIVHVAFLRLGFRAPIEVDGESCAIAEEVWAHFRDVSRITDLAEAANLHVTLIDRPFESQLRVDYVEHVVEVVGERPAPRLVLLDPDTGIEPTNARAEHVTQRDISRIWQSLTGGDWLVLYQHRSRRKNWRDETRARFATACGTTTHQVETIEAPGIASDVAFFAARKAKDDDGYRRRVQQARVRSNRRRRTNR